MKIWHISDTHGLHDQLIEPDDVDVIVFSGDESNSRTTSINHFEAADFMYWFSGLKCPNQVFIPGNHSTAIFNGVISSKEIESLGIRYLHDDYERYCGQLFYGNAFTPAFGNWSFMRDRAKLNKLWERVDSAVDVLITHGPPKYILDLTENRKGEIEFCGDSALGKHVRNRIRPKTHLFGHIHNYQGILNQGTRTIINEPTLYSNGSVVEDGRFDKGVVNNGNLITI